MVQEHVYVEHTWYKVLSYIDRPRQCTKCHRFYHIDCIARCLSAASAVASNMSGQGVLVTKHAPQTATANMSWPPDDASSFNLKRSYQNINMQIVSATFVHKQQLLLKTRTRQNTGPRIHTCYSAKLKHKPSFQAGYLVFQAHLRQRRIFELTSKATLSMTMPTFHRSPVI